MYVRTYVCMNVCMGMVPGDGCLGAGGYHWGGLPAAGRDDIYVYYIYIYMYMYT